MNKNKGQSAQIDQQPNSKVAIGCGTLLFLGGIFLGWGTLNIAPISAFWPGLVIGFYITLLIFYPLIRTSKQKKRKDRAKGSSNAGLGGIGVGLGTLFLTVFREHAALMVNIAGAATSLLLGIGLLSIVIALRKSESRDS